MYVDASKIMSRTQVLKLQECIAVKTRAHMTEISSFALINEFFVIGATERNTC